MFNANTRIKLVYSIHIYLPFTTIHSVNTNEMPQQSLVHSEHNKTAQLLL